MSTQAKMPLRSGVVIAAYDPPIEFKQALPGLQRTSLIRSVWQVCVQFAVIFGVSFALCMNWTTLPAWLAILGYAGGLFVIGRAMRGLELMVHDGSHRNWARRSRKVNDTLTNLLAGFPLLLEVCNYRTYHDQHHRMLGTEHDPERRRFSELQMDELPRSSWFGFLLRAIPVFGQSWFRDLKNQVRTPSIAMAFLAWHLSVVIVPLGFLVGFGRACEFWLAYWLIPMVLILPIIRFLAEGSEHRYSGGESITENTVSHYGWLAHLLLYPFGDGYHFLHHRFCSIPTYNLPRAHRLLEYFDRSIYGRKHLRRSSIFEEAHSARCQDQAE